MSGGGSKDQMRTRIEKLIDSGMLASAVHVAVHSGFAAHASGTHKRWLRSGGRRGAFVYLFRADIARRMDKSRRP